MQSCKLQYSSWKLAGDLAGELLYSVVKAKILAQGRVLSEFEGNDHGLFGYARRVASGDTGNVEAHAARRYWPLLFPASKYLRSNDEDARNHLLDYGYAVVRAAVARGLCVSGLHPSTGIHHRAPYNTFPLADDLMEPFRPAIDRVVRLEVTERLIKVQPLSLDQDSKRLLLEALTSRYRANDESRTLLDWITKTCQHFARVVSGDEDELQIPAWTADLRKNANRAVPDHVDICHVRSPRGNKAG